MDLLEDEIKNALSRFGGDSSQRPVLISHDQGTIIAVGVLIDPDRCVSSCLISQLIS